MIYCTVGAIFSVVTFVSAVTATGSVYDSDAVVTVGGGVDFDGDAPPQPLSPSTEAEPASIMSVTNRRPRSLRRHPNGRSRTAIATPPAARLIGIDSNVAFVVTVLNASVVLAAVLLPVKLRLAEAKVQAAPVGSVPQANVTVPV